mgnify:CR=1 FL=1
MNDRDAWIHFYCAIRNKDHISCAIAAQYADEALRQLRERDKQKLFDQTEGGYRDSGGT